MQDYKKKHAHKYRVSASSAGHGRSCVYVCIPVSRSFLTLILLSRFFACLFFLIPHSEIMRQSVNLFQVTKLLLSSRDTNPRERDTTCCQQEEEGIAMSPCLSRTAGNAAPDAAAGKG